jgi:hypothetical protein
MMKTWLYLLLAIVGANGYNDQQVLVENEPVAGLLRRFNVSGRHEAQNVVSLARVSIRRRKGLLRAFDPIYRSMTWMYGAHRARISIYIGHRVQLRAYRRISKKYPTLADQYPLR